MSPAPQHGILAPPPQHLLTAAMTFAPGATPAANLQVITELRELLRKELAGDLDEITATTSKAAPTAETGEVGVADGWEQASLTVDVGFSASGYTTLGLGGNAPADLIEVPWSRFGPRQPAVQTSGDLILHIRADSVFAVEHVLRRIEHTLAGRLLTHWTLSGTQRYGHEGSGQRDSGRSVIGFHDGLSNLDPSSTTDSQLIFVDPANVANYPANPAPSVPPGQPGYGGLPATPTEPAFPTNLRTPPTTEPAWTAGGSYMFVRGSTFNTALWDETTLDAQEKAVGRFKSSGAFLDRDDTSADKTSKPVFASDPTSTLVPPTAHARRANPRLAATDPDRRVLRRGYPLITMSTTGLMRGLTLITFSRSLSTQIEFIMAAWLANPDFPSPNAGTDPLLAFEDEILSGGYYFVPALADATDPTSWLLPS